MKPTSLERMFFTLPAQEGHTSRIPSRQSLEGMTFNHAYDAMRLSAAERAEHGDPEGALNLLDLPALDELTDAPLDILEAARLQIATALLIEADQLARARETAATLLSWLASEKKRKDEPFLQLLAALLYDIAFLHTLRQEFRQAERELDKALKLFERLAKSNPERYGSAHIMAQTAATSTYRSRLKQVNTLAHHQAATSTYLQMVNSGIEDATARLVDSLYTEGQTLVQMGRHREAVQFFSRALKFQTRLNPNFDLRQLEMSIDLGEALLNVAATRDKGIHLLNTMLHKATKLNADEQHRRIVDILLNAKTRKQEILGLWHKIFPR